MVCFSAISLFATAQTKETQHVEKAVAFLLKALESGERDALEQIASADLSYGHSSGLIENKKEFIEALVSKTSDFVKIAVANQTVSVTGNIAIVRHRLDANVIDKGTPKDLQLNILLIFRKETGEWKLLARHASRVI